METIEVNRLFVNEVVVNNKQLKHVEEANIINNVRDELLYVILENNIDEAKERCRRIIKEETNNEPIKGNIIFSVVPTDNNTDIEIVRHAHGGGNNSSVRVTGGVVVANARNTVTLPSNCAPGVVRTQTFGGLETSMTVWSLK